MIQLFFSRAQKIHTIAATVDIVLTARTRHQDVTCGNKAQGKVRHRRTRRRWSILQPADRETRSIMNKNHSSPGIFIIVIRRRRRSARRLAVLFFDILLLAGHELRKNGRT